MALIVDGIFNQFIRRPGRTEPFFSSYCNGTTSTCSGMSQHGSQALAVRGFTPLEILRHYYPSDINIVQSTNFGQRNPGAYPGTALREGSSGDDVRRIQFYLNRISGNWWIPAIQNPKGLCSTGSLITPENAQPTNTPPTFTRRIGGTLFTVSVYSSQTSKETIEDKLLRMIERGVRNSA